MFKKCPNCNNQWLTREHFLKDPDILLVGYQVNFKALTTGIVLFNHICKGTLAIHALELKDLYDGPVFAHHATDSSDCLGHCRIESDLAPCAAQCECAWVREVLQVVKGWPKAPQLSAARAG